MSKVIVTTGDLKQEYDVLGPVYFQGPIKACLVAHWGITKRSTLQKFKK